MVNSKTQNTPQQTLPPWLRAYVKPTDFAKIATAIKQVEISTSGEVVPMVVRRSMVTGHVLPMVFLMLGLFYVTVEALFDEGVLHGAHVAWFFVELGGLALLALILSRFDWMKRLMTSDADMGVQVLRRAETEFYKAGLHRTKDGTGVLIFVSVAERRAVVLADQGIAQHLPADTWSNVVTVITGSVKDGGLGQGFVEAISLCGALLAQHFPVKDHDRNELHDALVILE